MKTTVTTLVFLTNEDKILLAIKKRGFAKGKYNGIGGKVEANETIEQATVRECEEEIGVTPEKYRQFATITFHEFINGKLEEIIMHTFECNKWRGEPVESEEMTPEWFDKDKVPFENMLPDDKFWFPLFLAGKKFTAKFEFDENWKLLNHEIEEQR